MKILLGLLLLGLPVALVFMLFGIGFIKAIFGGIVLVAWTTIVSELARR